MSILDSLDKIDGLSAIQGTPPTIALDLLIGDPEQPRKEFDKEELQSLADSIAERGVLQPITVRPEVDGKHIIVMGERRWRAAQLAGLTEIPAIIREQHNSYDQVVENIQREDLSHSEIGKWICERIDEGEKAADIAHKLGRSKAWVSRYASFSSLPMIIQDRVDEFGMETGLSLQKSFKIDQEKTEWFMQTHADITRGTASIFYKSLSKPGTNSSNDTDRGEGNTSSFVTAEEAGLSGDGHLVSSGSAKKIDEDNGSEAPPSQTTKAPTPKIARMVMVRCEYDNKEQITRIVFNDGLSIEFEDGEEKEVDLSSV